MTKQIHEKRIINHKNSVLCINICLKKKVEIDERGKN